jgi:hypothetical protein
MRQSIIVFRAQQLRMSTKRFALPSLHRKFQLLTR